MKLRAFSTERLLELLRETSAKEAVNWSPRKTYVVTDDSIVKSAERDEMVAFLLEVCERVDMSLSTETFSLFVHLLDRFLSSYKVKSKYLECLAVACLYIACKVKEEDENIAVTAEFLAECECKCSIGELLRMEQMVLGKFEWNVNDTTAIDFVYIYQALLVNEYKRTLNRRVPSKERVTTSEREEEVPSVLDVAVRRVEKRLKKCLCVSELAACYRPQLMAYALMHIELEHVLAQVDDTTVQHALANTLEVVKTMGKLSYEEIDKCKYQIGEHVPYDDDDDDDAESAPNLWHLSRFYHHHRSAILCATSLDVIEEVDEEDDSAAAEQEQQKLSKLVSDEDEDEDDHLSTSSSASSLAVCSEFTYADVLLGRLKKRKFHHHTDFNSSSSSLSSNEYIEN